MFVRNGVESRCNKIAMSSWATSSQATNKVNLGKSFHCLLHLHIELIAKRFPQYRTMFHACVINLISVHCLPTLDLLLQLIGNVRRQSLNQRLQTPARLLLRHGTFRGLLHTLLHQFAVRDCIRHHQCLDHVGAQHSQPNYRTIVCRHCLEWIDKRAQQRTSYTRLQRLVLVAVPLASRRHQLSRKLTQLPMVLGRLLANFF